MVGEKFHLNCIYSLTSFVAARGQLITGAKGSPGANANDDCLEFSFGEPDPAAAPFRTPIADDVP
jgi:hypothetical protein